MTYPNYAVNVKADLRQYGDKKDFIKAWRHGRSWIVETRHEGMKQSKFYDDTWDAADAVMKAARELYLEKKLPVEEGLRRLHRLNDYMEAHR